MPHVKSLLVPGDTCYNSVREILGSTLKAVQANYGAFSLISAENGMLQNYASYGSLPGTRSLLFTESSVKQLIMSGSMPNRLDWRLN